MDQYSLERWMLDRQQRLECAAEAHGRRRGWRRQARLAELMAGRLRMLADRLDAPEAPKGKFTVVSGSR
jgi:hypothetical protein